MKEYNDFEQTNTDDTDFSNPSSVETKTNGINLTKDTDRQLSASQQKPQNTQTDIDGFPLGGTQNNQNGDYIAPARSNSHYISQNSLSNSDEKARTLAVVSLVCGLISIPLACCCSCCNFPFAIAGIITGFMSNYENGQKDNMAIAGIICSILALFAAIAFVLLSLILPSGTINPFFDL